MTMVASLVEEPLQNSKPRKFVSLTESLAMPVFFNLSGRLNKENPITALMFKFSIQKFQSVMELVLMVVFAKTEVASVSADSKAQIANLMLSSLNLSSNKQLAEMLVSLSAVEF